MLKSVAEIVTLAEFGIKKRSYTKTVKSDKITLDSPFPQDR